MDLERYRKDAKALVRAHRAGETGALARAQAVLGARGRFRLSDAQHVVAVEHGYRTWPDLKRAAEVAAVERARTVHEGQREGSARVVAALEAITTGDVERLERMLEGDPGLAGHVHDGAWNTLLEAIAQPDVVGEQLGVELGVDQRAVELLVEHGSPLDGALGLAACFNRAELVRMLLDAGADPAPSADEGLTPLETALYHGAREAAELLAELAISPYALWSVAALGRLDLLPGFVDAHGDLRPEAAAHRPNLADVGWQPGLPSRDDPQAILDEALGHAAHNGRTEAVEWLLDRGARRERPSVPRGHAAALRGAVRSRRDRASAARARRRSDDSRTHPREHAGSVGAHARAAAHRRPDRAARHGSRVRAGRRRTVARRFSPLSVRPRRRRRSREGRAAGGLAGDRRAHRGGARREHQPRRRGVATGCAQGPGLRRDRAADRRSVARTDEELLELG